MPKGRREPEAPDAGPSAVLYQIFRSKAGAWSSPPAARLAVAPTQPRRPEAGPEDATFNGLGGTKHQVWAPIGQAETSGPGYWDPGLTHRRGSGMPVLSGRVTKQAQSVGLKKFSLG